MPATDPQHNARGRSQSVPKVASSPTPTSLFGPVETATRSQLNDQESLSALGQVAIALARFLDEGAGMATAATAKELRATLAAIDGEGKADVTDAIAQLVSRLSSPVGNTAI